MKYNKRAPDASAKPKVKLSDKSKFKSKNTGDLNGHVHKGVKIAADLVKKGSLDKEMEGLVKSNIKGAKGFKTLKKKPTKIPEKLTPEVKLGLKLDQLLETKAQKKQGSSSQDSPVKTPPGKRSANELSPSQKSRRTKKKHGKKENDTLTHLVTNVDQMEKNSASVVNNETAATKKDKSSGSANFEATSNVDSKMEFEYGLVPRDVRKAVKCLLEQFKSNDKSKKLLDSESEPIFLKFCFYLPHNKQKTIRFNLPHTLVTDTSDICLIVTDIPKKSAEETQSHWEQILRDNNINNITEVISLKSLLTEYSQFQAKKKLSNRFDFFLVEGKISHRVYGILGKKFFHSQRKTPFPVKLDSTNMEEDIRTALSRTMGRYKLAALTFSIQVGHTGMTDKEIESNIMEVWKKYPHRFGVYWDNVKEASIFIDKIPALPLFYSLTPPVNGRPTTYKNMAWVMESNKPIVGELSTAMDKNVLVYPSGKVLVKNAPKPTISEEITLSKAQKRKEKNKRAKLRKMQAKSEEEEDEAKEELASDDDIGGRRDMLVSDSDEELQFEKSSSDEEPPTRNKSSDKGKGNIATKAKKKKNMEEDSDLVDKAEEVYLKDLASLKKKTSKAAAKKQKPTDSDGEGIDSDSESDEELSDVENPWGDEELMEETETDEDIPTLVPATKQNKFKKGGSMKSGKKVNGVAVLPSPKSKKKTLNKPGSGKSSPKNQRSKKPLKKPITEEQDNSRKKKTPEKSFQGVKTDQKKVKQKKVSSQAINKKIAKKFFK